MSIISCSCSIHDSLGVARVDDNPGDSALSNSSSSYVESSSVPEACDFLVEVEVLAFGDMKSSDWCRDAITLLSLSSKFI